MEETKKFFRFYEDGFTSTRPMYEKIIEALSKSGYIPKEYVVRTENGEINKTETLNKIVEECRRLDDNEVKETGGQVREEHIGLQGFFKSKGIDLSSDAMKKMGQAALETLPSDEEVDDEEKKSHYEAKAFLGQLSVGPYFPRLTCTSAAHFMGEGHVMQIGCSQGKTTVVAMTTYEQLMQGKKVFSTSSSPGLVPENYNEARKFYEKMGIAEQFCAISQDANDNVEHIVLFHQGKKYEVRADGKIWVENDVYFHQGKKYELIDNGKDDGKIWVENDESPDELKGLLEGLGLKLDNDGNVDFETSVKEMMATKGIIMGDTTTLGKYQHLMPQRNDNGVIGNSFLIVDEADAELLDTHPQELLGEKYSEDEFSKRRESRIKARDVVASIGDESTDLEKIAKENGVPLEFILDAYEARTNYRNQEQYTIRDGKLFILNPNTNVMIPAPQGLTQAILVNDESLERIDEIEVLGETDIPKLLSNFEVVSLMSGTMQDKGLSKNGMTEEYKQARENYLKQCGTGVSASIADDVIDWPLVTPMTRDEKGSVVVTRNGIKRKKDVTKGEDIETYGEEITSDWGKYLAEHKEELEKNWKELVQAEAKIRSESGKPVMVSVYGNRNPMVGAIDPVSGKPVRNYTDKKQIAQDSDKHKIGDDKCLFVKDGKGEIATFDDFYGRGYTFKFAKMDSNGEPFVKQDGEKKKPVKTKNGGHVLITSLPQNSRNLEQFLFRVARGGDKGSSSIIISPTDPVLIGFLEKLESEKGKDEANAYFRGVMNGTISVDTIVTDIYPKETEKIFNEKAKLVHARKIYDETQAEFKLQIGSEDEELSRAYSREYGKQMVAHMKYFRIFGVPEPDQGQEPDTKIYEMTNQLQVSVTKRLIEQGILSKPEKIVQLLPKGLSQEELAEIIPDEGLRSSIEQIYELKKTKPERVAEGLKKQGRSLTDEIPEAARNDEEYNIDGTRQTMSSIKQTKEEQIINIEEQKNQGNERR